MQMNTELVFLVDRSGSMRGHEADVIAGINDVIHSQSQDFSGENLYITTILFDNQYEMIRDRVEISRFPEITRQEYFVRGTTALLDAVGKAIQHVESNQEISAQAGKVIFVITTDGLENASRIYSYDRIRERIEAKQSCNWEFIFLGANIDSEQEAGKIGIHSNRCANYVNDKVGLQKMYQGMSRIIRELRNATVSSAVGGTWKKELCEDIFRGAKYGFYRE